MTDAALPPLRQELSIFPAPPNADGSPAWTLHDPASNRFFLLSWPAFEVASRWKLRTVANILKSVNAETTLDLTEEDVVGVAVFFEQNQLLLSASQPATERLAAVAKASRPGFWKWLLMNYLFIRLPLVKPGKFLDRFSPLAEPFFSRAFLLSLIPVALAAFYLVGRQWEHFTGYFSRYSSAEGLAAAALALFFAKIVHELGHAFAASRYGCRVGTMGVALVVMAPMLYTDTNEAWKLHSRRERLVIGLAGMVSELVLALAATWVWLLAPEGSLRGAAFTLATTTWVATLAVNLSPFMRFDGYFILSDLFNVPNLHARSFAFGRWRLREFLYGLGDPPPEVAKPALARFLTIFAWIVWVYRLVVFFGIAVLVYHYFFKALGVILFFVELCVFIAWPVLREASAWWKMRERVEFGFAPVRSLALLALLAAFLLYPWQSELEAPAALSAYGEHIVEAPYAALVTAEEVKLGDAVTLGAPLMRLASAEIDQKLRMATVSASVSRWRFERQAFDESLIREGYVLARKAEGGQTELAGIAGEMKKLIVTAPLAGKILARNPEIAPGVWLAQGEPLYIVADDAKSQVFAYVDEDGAARIRKGARAKFIPGIPEVPARECVVEEIDPVTVPFIEEEPLASTHGGPIPTRRDTSGKSVPESPRFRVRIGKCDPATAPQWYLTGNALIECEKVSLLSNALRNAKAILIKESGF